MKKVAYVYTIENTFNGKIYVGCTEHFEQRMTCHCANLKHGKHHSPYLQNDYYDHGEDSFIFTKVKECDIAEKMREEKKLMLSLINDGKVLYNSHVPKKTGGIDMSPVNTAWTFKMIEERAAGLPVEAVRPC